jgi:hypothetical protein
MRSIALTWTVLAGLLAHQPAAAQCPSTFTETFTGGSNDGEWGFGSPGDTHVPSGGNPGEFIGTQNYDTFTPRAQSTLGVTSVFHGDYRAAGVTDMGIDLRTFANQFPNSCMRPISIQLVSDPGTPGNFGDDTYVYFVSSMQAPCAGEGWKSYDFAVPAASATLPAGWAIDPNNPGAPDDVWNDVIEDVDQVLWWYGDPTFFFIFEQWSVGLDNPRMTTTSAPESYCTAGTSASGCQALMASSGVPSATAPSGFTLEAADVEGQKDGLFFFGTNGRQANPWGNGSSFQCVVPPVVRTPTMSGSGTVGACDGSFGLDLNALWCPSCPKPAKNPGAGALVQSQLWYRDPASTSNQTTSLSDALEFTVCPR